MTGVAEERERKKEEVDLLRSFTHPRQGETGE